MPSAERKDASLPQKLQGALAADRLTFKRRNYGAHPSGQPISKTQERQLRENGRLSLPLKSLLLQDSIVQSDAETTKDNAIVDRTTLTTSSGGVPSNHKLVAQHDASKALSSQPSFRLQACEAPKMRLPEQEDDVCCSFEETGSNGPTLGLKNTAGLTNGQHSIPLAQHCGGTASRSGFSNAGASSEITKLKALFKDSQSAVPSISQDLDLQLAQRLQAEELNINKKMIQKPLKRKLNSIDSYFKGRGA